MVLGADVKDGVRKRLEIAEQLVLSNARFQSDCHPMSNDG